MDQREDIGQNDADDVPLARSGDRAGSGKKFAA